MASPNSTIDPTSLPVPRRRLFLFDHPRTTSNLFMKVLGDDPNVTKIKYPFYQPFEYNPSPISRPNETYQEAFDRMTASIATAEEGGITPLIKEHACFFFDHNVLSVNMPILGPHHDLKTIPTPLIVDTDGSSIRSPTNPTVLPDRFLHSVSPIFLFRHPARLIPSYYRASKATSAKRDVRDRASAITASLRWLRLLYDWYCNDNTAIASGNDDSGSISAWPIVIESDDFIHEPQIMRKLCAAAGLDPKYLQYEWDPVPVAERRSQRFELNSFHKALQASRGLEVPETRDCEIDLEEERGRLMEEFGDDVGGALADYVDLAMGDYWYLRRFRLK